MGHAVVAFTDPRGFAETNFPPAGTLENERLSLGSQNMSDYCFEGIIGKSAAIRTVLEQVSIVAPTDATVLLHGETGTGKELIARAIHKLSSRRERPFVPHELRGYSLRAAGERNVRARKGGVHRRPDAEERADSN